MKESNCESNSINFGEFTREDIDKIMVNGGYEKDPNDVFTYIYIYVIYF